ncbi:hypothetical protein, partial [Streptococcus pyogenes]|uniref:hypothetical protein n=1 Tax=Streptococcus pyogenes TaxID=1314 RepID=UPI003DA0DE40
FERNKDDGRRSEIEILRAGMQGIPSTNTNLRGKRKLQTYTLSIFTVSNRYIRKEKKESRQGQSDEQHHSTPHPHHPRP